MKKNIFYQILHFARSLFGNTKIERTTTRQAIPVKKVTEYSFKPNYTTEFKNKVAKRRKKNKQARKMRKHNYKFA